MEQTLFPFIQPKSEPVAEDRWMTVKVGYCVGWELRDGVWHIRVEWPRLV